MMKKTLSVFTCVILSVCTLTAQNNTNFYCSYDSNLDDNTAAGTIKGVLNPKSLSEIKDVLRPDGIARNGLLIGCTAGQVRQYSVDYPGNVLSAQSGTISFWIKPLDWQGADKEFFKMFLSASGSNQQIYIYKYQDSQKLYFYCSAGGQASIAECSIANWNKNEWHHVAGSWAKDELHLYVDGASIGAVPLKKGFETDFTSLTVGTLGWEKDQGTSLMDELKIYKRMLSPEEIQQEYSKYSSNLVREKSPVNITVGKRTPLLDGKIARFEYAFGGTGFFNLVGKTYSAVQSRYYLSYDDKYLYVGVATPAGCNMISDKQTRDGNLWEDDSIEIYLYPNQKIDGKYQFIFNSKGVFYDSKNGDSGWNIKEIQVVSKTKDDQWILEAAFPFSELGATTPSAGENWKINICRSFQDNMHKTTLGPCNMGYNDLASFAAIVFTDGIPVVDIESLGCLNNNVLDFKMNIMSTVNADAILTLDSPGNARPYHFEKNIKIPSGKAESVTAKTTNLPPSNVLNVDLKTGDNRELYRAVFEYRDLAPINVSYIYTDIDKQILNIVCSDSGSNSTRGEKFLIMKMLDDNSKVIIEEKVPLISKKLIFTIPFNIAKLPPGEYKFAVNCVDKSGKTLLEHWEMYCKPPENPAWNNTSVGVTDKVPYPWIPITATRNQFKCWGRDYSFNGSCLLSSLKSQGLELLAGPIILCVNGQNAVADTCELFSSNETTAKYRLTSSAGDIKINAEIKAEFDGFLWIDLEYSPALNTAKIKTMTLDIPLTRKYITGFDDCHSLKDKVDMTTNADRRLSYNFAETPSCWIGGDDVGLMIGARNLKGWHVKNKNKSLEIIPDNKIVVLRLNLVDTPLQITGSRRIGFYLEATPVKPLNRKVKSIRNEANTLMWSGFWTKYFNYFIEKDLDFGALNQFNQHRKTFQLFHYTAAHGASPYSPEWNYYGMEWHSSPPSLGDYCVDSDVSSKLLRNRNTFTYGCLDCKSFFDFNLATLSAIIKRPDIGIENLYIDLAWPKMCGNKKHGCGYIDEFGENQSSFDIIGTREYYKHLYNVLKDKNSEAMICMHIVATRTPADSFADVLVFGEGYDRDVAAKESYYDVLNPEVMRIAYASRGKEQEIWLIPQFTRGFLLFRPERAITWKPEQPEAARAVKHFLGYMTVHNISFMRGLDTIKPSKQLYDAQDWLGWGENIDFFPYWRKSDNPVGVISPLSGRIMVSTFARNGKAIIAVLNDTDKNSNIELKVDTSKLFKQKTMYVTGIDAMEQHPVKIEIKNEQLIVPLEPRGFKLLTFSLSE